MNNYEAFINTVPAYTQAIINRAIEIFYNIFDNELIFSSNSNQEPYVKKLYSEDKVVIALFLANLSVPGTTKEIFQENGITTDLVYKYSNISYKETRLSIEHLRSYCYTFFFSPIIAKIVQSQNIDNLEDLTPEALVCSLSNKLNCNSDIINWLFEQNKNTSHNSAFLKIQSEYKKKKKATAEPPKSNDDTKSKDNQDSSANYINSLGKVLNGENFLHNPAIGREEEIKELIIALMTPETSAILVGEPATGKTAIVEGLAYLINKNEVPNALKNKRIIKININSLIAGTQFRGTFEEKVEKVLKEAMQDESIILFLDEIHTAIGAGSGYESNNDLANILKPYLDRGKIRIISATTIEEYEKYISSDEAFKRRFERIDVFEPNTKVVAEILKTHIPKLEQITGVKFPFSSQDVIEITIFLANITIKKNRNPKDNVNNPDLAIKIFSKAFVLASYENSEYVKIEHIAESIKRSTRLNKLARVRLANLLITKFLSKESDEPRECQIIELPKKR